MINFLEAIMAMTKFSFYKSVKYKRMRKKPMISDFILLPMDSNTILNYNTVKNYTFTVLRFYIK